MGIMAPMLDPISVLVAWVGFIAAGAHVGYLALLGNAASKRAGGGPVADYVKSRWPIALITTGVGLVAILLSNSNIVFDLLAIAGGAGAGLVGFQALQSTRKRFRSGG